MWMVYYKGYMFKLCDLREYHFPSNINQNRMNLNFIFNIPINILLEIISLIHIIHHSIHLLFNKH